MERASELHVLSGWGESTHAWSRVHRPTSADEVASLLAAAGSDGRSVALRGAGRSYGDAATLGSGTVLDMTACAGIRSFSETTGVIDVDAGVTIEQLWRHCAPKGYWPSVVPGTMRPTVGGCLAMNVHGKNQFSVGGFGEYVEELEVAFPDGSVRRLDPERDERLFHSVIGGLGLLGVVTGARLRMKQLHSGLLEVDAFPVPNLERVIEEFESRAPESDYLVAWVDCFDPNARSVIHTARNLGPGEDPGMPGTLAIEAQDLPPKIFGVVPRSLVALGMTPFGNPAGMRLINVAKYLSARLSGETRFRQSHVAFSFLLDYVPDWKRIYRPGGLIQYQSFVPREHALRVHTEQLRLCREAGIVSWLGVYKKHRPDPFLMSHCLDGYSFAMDFPVTAENRQRLWALCREMDAVVGAAGGRFYPAKDLTAEASTLAGCYPELDTFRAIKREVDPGGVLTSDLARRLRI